MGNVLRSYIELIYEKFLLLTVAISNGNLLDEKVESIHRQPKDEPPPVNESIERQNLLIVIGNTEEIIIDFIQEVMQDILGRNYDLEFIATHSPETIFEISRYRKVDLYILMLNNLIHTSDQFPGNSNAEQSLSLIKALKLDKVTPIISLSGIQSAAAMAIPAGADHSLMCPFTIAEITQCIESSLKLNNAVD
ncbi:MAG TPA: hypothetical protein VHP63_05675 [candidate division Zixibacteria bacterium]|nr:hypothetical protein [candidate division Zixibacteria bacterium]